ncbi:olfactory receptor 5V1-like [Pleurodeles waltl]|uniref:olfactory receptor 5V1-like n=1 Tax=Pleurodeles waltl TaxID=8319 RepID=UPI0037094FEE
MICRFTVTHSVIDAERGNDVHKVYLEEHQPGSQILEVNCSYVLAVKTGQQISEFLVLSEEEKNISIVLEFCFLGFENLQGLQMLVFSFLSFFYILTLVGNLAIIGITTLDAHLNGPMFYLLRHLSILDICYISVTVPKMLDTLLSGQHTISFTGCMVQLSLFISLEGTEAFLLTAMAYDRFIAICYPLRYTLLMDRKLCLLLAGASWVSGIMNSVVHTTLIVRLPFCGSNCLQNVFCDIPPLLHLSCADTHLNELVLFTVGGTLVGLIPFLSILVSYIYIAATIVKMSSNSGKQKAFSTCASHLIVVTLFYGAAIFTYIRPASTYGLERDRLVSVLYSIVTPMLNPLIYSWRSQELKRAFKRLQSPLYY